MSGLVDESRRLLPIFNPTPELHKIENDMCKAGTWIDAMPLGTIVQSVPQDSIQKLQQDQRRQYVDLDRRVAALAPNRPAPGPSPIPAEDIEAERKDVEGNLESGLPNLSTSGVSPRLDVKPASEREAYAQAIEWMRAKRFADSSAAFEQLIVDYPNGQFTPNAFYWLGELNLATANMESARQNFVQVIRLYPDHQKVPDALYKLGVLYFQLGDETESRKYLGRVESEYPQSSAGALAKRYLAEME